MSFIGVVFCCATIAAVTVAATVQRQWIDNRNHPGGPMTVTGVDNIAGESAFIIATWFTDAMMVSKLFDATLSCMPKTIGIIGLSNDYHLP
jgi:hypothetical protein